MNHLLSPLNPASPSIKVPFVGKVQYDGGSFFEYPTRMGRKELAVCFKACDPLGMVRDAKLHPVDAKDKESFLQTWLFFGLLSEFCNSVMIDVAEPQTDGFALEDQSRQHFVASIYEDFVYEEDGQYYVTTDELLALAKLLVYPQDGDPRSKEFHAKRYSHLASCLYPTWLILRNLWTDDQDEAIRNSISALGELLSRITMEALDKLSGDQAKFQYNLVMDWSTNYYTGEIQRSMIKNGWCLSDIKRCEETFNYMQTLHLLSRMEKLPARNHSSCTPDNCYSCQINMAEYQVEHVDKDCACDLFPVDNEAVIRALQKPDVIPLLKVTSNTGDLGSLKVEVVESTRTTPYVAISHVWADGLGNPFSNSLYQCQIVRLQNLINSIEGEEAGEEFASATGVFVSNKMSLPLLWIDSLCCPVSPADAKRLSIEKLRGVYEKSYQVLVLDAGLLSVNSKQMELSEQLVRIFTSSWMRRLWTMQEAALPNSLWYQFKDQALAHNRLYEKMFRIINTVSLLGFRMDMFRQFWRIDSYFHAKKRHHTEKSPDLVDLDLTLQHRSASVSTDEPLCIAALMSLSLKEILSVPEERRMEKLWELLAKKHKGIPAGLLFFDGVARLKTPGWRWASSTFLGAQRNSLLSYGTRVTRWNPLWQLGRISPYGLRVRFPGFLLKAKQYDDGLPRFPWRGFKRIAEGMVLLRDSRNGNWFRIVSNHEVSSSQNESEESRDARMAKKLFPVHDLAGSGDSALIIHEKAVLKERLGFEGSGDGLGGFLGDCLLVKVIKEVDDLAEEDSKDGLSDEAVEPGVPDEVQGELRDEISNISLDHPLPPLNSPTTSQPQKGLAVETQMLTTFKPLSSNLQYFHNKIDTLAHQIRQDPLTLKLLGADEDEESDAFKAVRDEFKQTVINLMQKAMEEDERLREAAREEYPEEHLKNLWVLVIDFFRHDFWGEWVEEGIWFVD